mgnify:CR=1 FL=1|jgi:short-subunit dehydrogenase involved in D-alanine esterification of teichoic acids
MEYTKIKKLIELLQELQQIEYWNDENLIDDEETEIEIDLYSNIELTLNFINKNYIMQNKKAWCINKKEVL